MPTVYQDRVGISLYDAQWQTGEKAPIPAPVIADVVRALRRFKRTCEDFGIDDNSNVRIIATEATRQAINSDELRSEIHLATGWTVEMLPKEDEGRVGAMGVASSFTHVEGLMMDLGGGSTQLTWLVAEDGMVRMSEAGSVSMPYGAAALSRRLDEANKAGKRAITELREEITTNVREAVAQIKIPQEILDKANGPDGLSLYLSGGGFRGWGFILMSQHPVSPYPIPVINGFRSSTEAFQNTESVKSAATGTAGIFRVSDRRASQVPAVALLISCLMAALPSISTVHFAQGGVREGALYSTLDKATRAQHPLVTATLSYSPADCERLRSPLLASIPIMKHSMPRVPAIIDANLINAFTQSLYVHNSYNKDIQAAAALRCTTSGILSSVHGADHLERAVLALMLCERWDGPGALSTSDQRFYRLLNDLTGPDIAWWCLYIGRVGALVGELYPAGVVRGGQATVDVKATWVRIYKQGKKADGFSSRLHTEINFGPDDDGVLQSASIKKALKRIQGVGKKRQWPDGETGYQIDLRVIKAGELVDLSGENADVDFA